MEINAVKVKELRMANGWTQQHLADACAISLRTVQRVEKFGSASQETLMSLCAVFELPQEQLLDIPNPAEEELKPISMYRDPLVLGISALAGGVIGAFLTYMLLT